MQTDTMANRFGSQPGIVAKPWLFLLAPFLASLPVTMPNARIVRDVFGIEGIGVEIAAAFSVVALVVSLVLFALSKSGKQSKGFSKTVERIAAALFVVLLASLYVVILGGKPNALLISVIVGCMALALVPLIFGWVESFKMDMRSILFYGALSCAGAAAIAWLLSWLPPIGFAIGSVVCAIVGCIPIVVTTESTSSPDETRIGDSETDARIEARGEKPNTIGDLLSMIWAPFLGLLVCVFISNASEFNLGETTMHSEFIGAFVAALVAVIACLASTKAPFVMTLDFIVTPVLIVLAIFFGSFQPGDLPFIVGAALVFAPLMFMTLFSLSLLESVITAGDFSESFVLCVALAAISLAALLGIVAGKLIPAEVLAPYTWVIACAYFAIALVRVGYVAWRTVTRQGEAFEIGADADAGEVSDGAGEKAASAVDAEAEWQAELDRLADEHGLTAREREILGYMSRGYGSAYISKVLFISDNTARTHTRNIYRKLGVHSREELLAMFA